MNDLINIMPASFIPNMGQTEFPRTLNSDLASGSGMGEGSDFVDLLSTVKDLEVAETQLTDVHQLNEEMFRDLTNKSPTYAAAPLTTDFLGPTKIDQKSAELTVGQKASYLSSETVDAKDLLLDSASLSSEAQLRSVHLDNQSHALKTESVAQWASALASGDIKNVVVENSGRQNFDQQMKPIVTTATPVAELGSRTELHETNVSGEQLKGSSFVERREQLVLENSLGGDIYKDTVTDPTQKTNGFGAIERSVNKAADSFKETASETGGLKKKSTEAKDFLLDHQVGYSRAAEKASFQEMPVFLAPASIGEPTDNRMAPDALNFMADKIESLQAQGGGRLKLELNPKELGLVEIKVSMRGGKLNVDLSAERQETLSAINNSKSQLLDKLTTVGPANLVITPKLEPMFARQGVEIKGSNSSLTSNSQEMISLRDLSGSSQARNVQDTIKVGSNVEAVRHAVGRTDFDGGVFVDGVESLKVQTSIPNKETLSESRSDSSGWQRDDRREQARQKWQDFRERKSA